MNAAEVLTLPRLTVAAATVGTPPSPVPHWHSPASLRCGFGRCIRGCSDPDGYQYLLMARGTVSTCSRSHTSATAAT